MPQAWDFFLSYTQADRPWAEWIAWVLEENGYRVLIQAWDFVPGTNWIAEMQAGTRDSARTVAVLSDAYLQSVYGGAEWQAAWASDPVGTDRKLLVVRVSDCDRPGLLAGVVSIDLFGLYEDQARDRLAGMAAAAQSGRAKPARAPGFPGTQHAASSEPGFPGGPLPADALGPAREGADASRDTGSAPPQGEPAVALQTPVIIRWRGTLSGFEAASVSRLMQINMSHRGYMRPIGTEPPSARIALAIGSGPVGPAASPSALRARFGEFLGKPAVMEAITTITRPGEGAAWVRQAGNGRAVLEAVLASSTAGSEDAPVAAAKLLLPEADHQRYGGDAERAVLILHIEPRDQDGRPAAPAGLAAWYQMLARVLSMAPLLACFLTGELGLRAAETVPGQAGIWLRANRSLAELVDYGELLRLQGATPSSEISVYAITDLAGGEPEDVAVDLLSEICEYGLRLDDYEPVLHRLTARVPH